jgi:hypothetical protein
MKKYWASAILFWTLAFALQKKLFIRFWKKLFGLILSFMIFILDTVKSMGNKICIACTPQCKECKDAAIKSILESDIKIQEKFEEMLYKIYVLEERVKNMELNLETLAAEVARVHTVQSSAATMLKKLTVELEKVSAELAAKAAQEPPVIDTAPLNALIEQLKSSTDALAGAVADSSNVIPTKEVILHADDPTVPTVQVNLPEVMPEVVTVSAETVVDTVDTTSAEPQVVVTVTPADDTTVTEEDVVADVIKTDEGQVDVVVTAPAEVAEAVKAEANVDVVDAVKEAFDVTPEVVAEPVAEAPKTE